MRGRTRWAMTGGIGLAVALIGGGIALAASSDDEDTRPDVAISGQALERASSAALRHVDDPGAKVTETEVDDEESKFEVEVTLGDGTQVDVQLDEDFQVVGTERDGTRGEGAGADD